MARRPDNPVRSAGFFRQGLLILLPTALLASVGIWALRRDYVQTRQEVREQARVFGDAAANQLWAELNNLTRPGWDDRRWLGFTIDAGGALVAPAPLPPLEPRSIAAQEIPEGLRAEWTRAIELASGADPLPALESWRDLADKPLPESARAIAQFHIGQALDTSGRRPEAAAAFHSASASADAILDSGLPLRMLAAWREFETDPTRLSALEMACSDAVQHPNLATSELLRRASKISNPAAAAGIVQGWRDSWVQDETRRFLWRAGSQYARSFERMHSNSPPRWPRALWPAFSTFWEDLRDARIAAGLSPGEALVYHARPTARPLLWSPSTPSSGEDAGRNYVAYFVWIGPFGEADADLQQIRNAQASSNALGIWPLPLHSLLKAANLVPPKSWSLVVSFDGEVEFSEHAWGGRIFFPGAELLAVCAPAHHPDSSLQVKLYLTNAAAYFGRQRQRLWGFSLVLLAAAGASVFGFFSARRAFLRQQQLSEMKSNFVSSVSHELRAPIASVRLMAENLERGKVTDAGKQHDYFRFIVQECRRLSSLIENVLDFARIEQRRKQYDFEPTDLGALVDQSVKLMEPAAAEKNVTLQIEGLPRSAEPPLGANPEVASEKQAEQGLGAPLLDAQAIQQALVNLLDNAIKHSPGDGIVTVRVSLNPQLSILLLSVADQGPGIPEAEHEKIFERFYRRGSELRRETPGVGIGLSIVKHIAEAHGGRVIVESASGQGSRFTIEVPVGKLHIPSSKLH